MIDIAVRERAEAEIRITCAGCAEQLVVSSYDPLKVHAVGVFMGRHKGHDLLAHIS